MFAMVYISNNRNVAQQKLGETQLALLRFVDHTHGVRRSTSFQYIRLNHVLIINQGQQTVTLRCHFFQNRFRTTRRS